MLFWIYVNVLSIYFCRVAGHCTISLILNKYFVMEYYNGLLTLTSCIWKNNARSVYITSYKKWKLSHKKLRRMLNISWCINIHIMLSRDIFCTELWVSSPRQWHFSVHRGDINNESWCECHPSLAIFIRVEIVDVFS